MNDVNQISSTIAAEGTTTGTQNLVPFRKNDPRTNELARIAGSKTTPKKRLAAKIRELKRRFPASQATITELLAILTNLDRFKEVSETELIELALLKEEAIEQAQSPIEKYRLQGSYVRLLAEIGETFYGIDRIRQNHSTNAKISVYEWSERFFNRTNKNQ